MYSVVAYITIGALPAFTIVNKINIKSSWQGMTTKCTIVMPRNIKMGNTPLKSLIKRNDAVTVSFGYNGKTYQEFSGYVTYIKPTTPLEIECEDEMYQLKKGSFTKAWANATLDDIIQYIYPSAQPWVAGQGGKQYRTFGSVQVGAFSISNCTPAKVLQEVEKVLGLKSFFRTMPGDTTPTLIVGYPYDSAYQKTATYHFNKNVVSNSLEFHSKDDLSIGVKATSMLPNGGKIEITLGDKDGEQHTLHYYNLPKDTLTQKANADYQKLMYDGYRGSFKAFGYPRINHGDVVYLQGSSEQLIIGQVVGDYQIEPSTSGIFLQGTNVLSNGTSYINYLGDSSATAKSYNLTYSNLTQVQFEQALAADFKKLAMATSAYYIDGVDIDFGYEGYSREAKLGPPAVGMCDFLGKETFVP